MTEEPPAQARECAAVAGVTELGAAATRLSAPRALTQRLSRYVYEPTGADSHRRFAGIRYPSRLGDDFENWAILEPAELRDELEDDAGLIGPDNPDLRAAMRLHRMNGLTIPRPSDRNDGLAAVTPQAPQDPVP